MDEGLPVSPGRSFKERITDYFNPAVKLDHNYVLDVDLKELVSERVNEHDHGDSINRDSSSSPCMPVLLPMVVPGSPPSCLRLINTDSGYSSQFPVDNSPPILSPSYPTECPQFFLHTEQLPNLLIERTPPQLIAEPQLQLPYQESPHMYQEQVPQFYQELPRHQEVSQLYQELSYLHQELPHHQELCHHQPLSPPSVSTVGVKDVADGASDRSEGDSGKENEVEDSEAWRGSRSSLGSRGSRPKSGHLASTGAVPKVGQLLKERSQEKAPVLGDNNSGRVTRSQRNHDDGHQEPLSLLNCERLEHFDKSPTPIPRSPPTPHKIKMPNKLSPANALQKLKISSQGLFARTPKKKTSTKGGKSTKRLGSSAPDVKSPAPHSKAGKLVAAAESSRKVTEYFPIRRSERKPKNEQLKEQMEGIEARLLATDDTGLDLEVVTFSDKGRGVVSTRDLKKGEFVVEYAGDIIDVTTAKERELKYSLDVNKGCYMYYFKHKGKNYCIDGTSESGRIGRLVNHSCKQPNMVTKVVELGQDPRLILIAKQDISKGIELLYDYGDRDKESLKAHPWLAS